MCPRSIRVRRRLLRCLGNRFLKTTSRNRKFVPRDGDVCLNDIAPGAPINPTMNIISSNISFPKVLVAQSIRF